MEIQNDYLNASTIYSELALTKRSELANIDKKELEKSTLKKVIVQILFLNMMKKIMREF